MGTHGAAHEEAHTRFHTRYREVRSSCTYHVGGDCSSSVRVYDFSPLNTCIPPTEAMPYFHIEFCSVEDSPSGDYNITQCS